MKFWPPRERLNWSIGPKHIRAAALIISLPACALALTTFFLPQAQLLVAHGPIQKGHEAIDCSGCHTDSPGTTRQQIQANFKYAIGLREHGADFGFAAVGSDQCLDCHARPNERHPIYRFNEPRFVKAVAKIEANSCLGCHSEHQDQRSTASLTFCSTCHEDLSLKHDPIDVPHATLVEADNWESCMGCHDFHGNHSHRVPQRLADAYDASAIQAYLNAAPSPYGAEKLFKGKEQ